MSFVWIDKFHFLCFHRKKGQTKLQETYSTLKIRGVEVIKAVYSRGVDNVVRHLFFHISSCSFLKLFCMAYLNRIFVDAYIS